MFYVLNCPSNILCLNFFLVWPLWRGFSTPNLTLCNFFRKCLWAWELGTSFFQTTYIKLQEKSYFTFVASYSRSDHILTWLKSFAGLTHTSEKHKYNTRSVKQPKLIECFPKQCSCKWNIFLQNEMHKRLE